MNHASNLPASSILDSTITTNAIALPSTIMQSHLNLSYYPAFISAFEGKLGRLLHLCPGCASSIRDPCRYLFI